MTHTEKSIDIHQYHVPVQEKDPPSTSASVHEQTGITTAIVTF